MSLREHNLIYIKIFVVLIISTAFFVTPILFPKKISAVSVSDNFNRSNGGLGSNWTTISGTQNPEINNNVVGIPTNSALHSSYWSSDTFSNNQYAQAKFPNVPGGINYGPGIAVRLANSRGYILWWGNNADKVSLWRMDNSSTWNQIGISNSLTISGTDVWKITAVGTSIKGYQNNTAVVEATDTNYSSGNPGIWLFYDSNKIDDWSAGDIDATTYTVGGTVSGLTGTVVLKNNGSDNLSISSDGSFVFGNSLFDSENYNVTVYTQPSGKTCSVTNGSGTVNGSNITNVLVTCTSGVFAEDNFNRADGSLGASWTDFSAGGLNISSQKVVGTLDTSGVIRTAEIFTNNQYSEIEVTDSQLSGNRWIGPTVRTGNGGQDLYIGLYWWNSGNPVLRIYKKNSGTWTQLGSEYNCGALSSGTKLKIIVVGNTISFLLNDIERIAVYDNSITSGAPGIAANDIGTYMDNWSGGDASFEAHYLSTDGNGVKTYNMISNFNGYGPHILRVLEPTNPASGKAHNIIYVLPVEEENYTTYGDGLETLRTLDAHNQYNLTIVAPQFHVKSWYADHPTDANKKYESFMVYELYPWVNDNLETTSTEQHWLLGFSKSGMGSIGLIFKHPDIFTLAAVWDFPANMSSYNQYDSADNYGTDANFQNNYRLTSTFIETNKTNFLINNRIWLSGYDVFQTNISDFDTLLTSKGIVHTLEPQEYRAHTWTSGWVPLALSGLYQESITYRDDTTPPEVLTFTIPSTATSLTISVTEFTASDNIAVTGYLLTESDTTPSVNNSGWSQVPYTSYTFSSSGNKNLWAWAKDADGNISLSKTASLTISLNSSTLSTASSNNSASCSDQSPGSKAPYLYAATPYDSESIKLYFTEAEKPYDKYVLEYGTESGVYTYGINDLGIYGENPVIYTVKSLNSGNKYYFRVRGGNGCAVGPWSNEISSSTESFLSFNKLTLTNPESITTKVEDSCKTYTVVSGDTLWDIAQNLLGSGQKFTQIVEQNKERYPLLASSEDLKIGWELKIDCGVEKVTESDLPQGYEVEIKVLDDNQKPVKGAVVTLYSSPRTEITDENGIAHFGVVEPGEHKVLISYEGYQGEESINLGGEVKEISLKVNIEKKSISRSSLILIVFAGTFLVAVTLFIHRRVIQRRE